MRQDQKLEHIAAKIDDISETLEEIRSTVGEGGTTSSRKLDEVQAEVKRAADAIDKRSTPSRRGHLSADTSPSRASR